MRWLDFFWVFLPCLSMMVLSLLALGLRSMYIGQGSRIQFVWIWISFLDSLFFSWLIVWVDGINKCDWCPGGSTGWWLNGLHQIPKVSWLFHHCLHFNIYYILSIVPGMQCHMYYYYQWWCVCVCLCGVRIWFLLGYVVFVVEFLSCAFVFCSLLFSVPLFRWLEDDGCCVASLFLLYLPCLWFVQLGVTAACKLSVILHKKKTNNK